MITASVFFRSYRLKLSGGVSIEFSIINITSCDFKITTFLNRLSKIFLHQKFLLSGLKKKIYEVINPRLLTGKFAILGKTADRSESVKPNHRASVAAY